MAREDVGARTLYRRGRRKIGVGDFRDRIRLQVRTIDEPGQTSTNYDEDFQCGPETWAMVRTTSGKTVFDGVDTDISITHEITIRYDPDVTSETWVLLADDTRLKISVVEDYEERHEYQRLLCVARGDREQGASKA